MMNLKIALFLAALMAFACADDVEMEKMEDSTVSPIADMAVIESEMNTSTERPPTVVSAMPIQEEKPSSQRHTVADFIIHPLIAFKPRNPEEDQPVGDGKQADGATSSTTASPWQLFGFNAGQGLGSSVSSLAGQVTGWINDRIQFPGLVETPVRETSTTSTTSTTTIRPDVVVNVQHKGSTRRPIISLEDRNRPNRPNFNSIENDDDDEDDEDDYDSNEGSQEAYEGGNSEENGDNEVDEEEEDTFDDEVDENHSQRPNNRRRPVRKQNNNNQRRRRPQQANNNNNKNNNNNRLRRQQNQNQNFNQNNYRRRVPNRQWQQQQQQQKQGGNFRRRPVARPAESVEDFADDDEYADQDHFYYGSRPSTKRSQSNPNFIQRGQQQILNQIRQLTRGQTPGEIGTAIRKSQKGSANNNRRQQATLFVNRNGQTIYLAPELATSQFQQPIAQPVVHKAPTTASAFPQPPLTVPLKRKGQPTQYITIPWAQLGISPPNNIVSVTEGIQTQPLILNIPQSAINAMQSQGQTIRKKNRPQLITADAVPLLAEASLMDIFKPPQIPPSRTSNNNRLAATLPVSSVTPVLVAARPTTTKTSTGLLQQRIKPGTLVEKSPKDIEKQKIKIETETETEIEDESNDESNSSDASRAQSDNEYILVGNDQEPGVVRHVKPAYGEARYVQVGDDDSDYFEFLPRRHFALRRGRTLTPEESAMPEVQSSETEQLIPVRIESGLETVPEKKFKPLTLPKEEVPVPQNGEGKSLADQSTEKKFKPLTLPKEEVPAPQNGEETTEKKFKPLTLPKEEVPAPQTSGQTVKSS